MALNFFQKLRRKWMKIRLRPIRVFCLHHVCEQFDVDAMHPCDWIALDEFKQKINVLRSQGYQFISIAEACNYMKKDYFRRKKYAVLTFDDGYKSINEVLPWLEEQQIPATLFINGKYLDGESYRETPKEQYLTYDELFALTSQLIEIGHHGWEHKSVQEMSGAELIDSMQKNIEILSSHPRYIPFWAYTYGIHDKNSDVIISNYGMTLVLVNGGKNYKWMGTIDRELL
jgi:peptidoglycan/xylan/chitin deacetylase (PgdA/CDA1 family)